VAEAHVQWLHLVDVDEEACDRRRRQDVVLQNLKELRAIDESRQFVRHAPPPLQPMIDW